MMPQVCARCQRTTSQPVVVAIEYGASVGGGTVFACPDCAPTYPKQRDPFDPVSPPGQHS
ncbi:hypothetical protein SSOG_05963 [Streptomyces himastatinicus ATCC 53653]|uniref:Uncharacterized protein n=1 Tax=Streptomyces himastatinicus ATCC 53653 TaxID=457427 RepID=D9WT28_9ACTN|nr:hypothetical protein SSOG_05963 [Streptomyces himastatinicus ATCC 53653]